MIRMKNIFLFPLTFCLITLFSCVEKSFNFLADGIEVNIIKNDGSPAMSSLDNIFVVSFSNKVETNQEDVLVYNCDIGNISYNKQSGNENFETPIGVEVCWNSNKGNLEKDDGSIKQYGCIDIVAKTTIGILDIY